MHTPYLRFKRFWRWRNITLFGLHSTPATFQTILDTMRVKMDPHAFTYLDDIIVIR